MCPKVAFRLTDAINFNDSERANSIWLALNVFIKAPSLPRWLIALKLSCLLIAFFVSSFPGMLATSDTPVEGEKRAFCD